MKVSKEKLTLERLKEMAPNAKFAHGRTKIMHPWKGEDGWKDVCDEDGMTEVNWVAVRGRTFHDWSIYHSLSDNLFVSDHNNYFNNTHLVAGLGFIASLGTKLHDMEKVQELVPCDEEALELYRH